MKVISKDGQTFGECLQALLKMDDDSLGKTNFVIIVCTQLDIEKNQVAYRFSANGEHDILLNLVAAATHRIERDLMLADIEPANDSPA